MYADQVSIVVITHNRPQFISRFANCLEELQFGGHLIVSESSSESSFSDSQRRLRSEKFHFQLTHLHIKKRTGQSVSQSMNDCLKAGIERINTSYAMMSCDDDIPLPVSLDYFQKFLAQNHEYNGAVGDYKWIEINNSETPSLTRFQKVLQFLFPFVFEFENISGRKRHIIPTYSLEKSTAGDRLVEYIESMFHTMFVLVRAETLRHIIPENTEQIEMPHFKADYSWMFGIALAGRIRRFERLHILRQFHGANLSQKNDNHPFPTYTESILSKSWFHDANIFVDNLANWIESADIVPPEFARKLALSGFRKLSILRLAGDNNERPTKRTTLSKVFRDNIRTYQYAIRWCSRCRYYNEMRNSIANSEMDRK